MCPMCISKKELYNIYPLKLRFWATLSTFTFVASCCTPDSPPPFLRTCGILTPIVNSQVYSARAKYGHRQNPRDSRNKATTPGSDAQNRRCLQPRIPQVKHLRIPGFFRCTNVQSSQQNQHHKNQLLAPQWDCWRLERHWRQWRTSPPPTVLLGMSNSAWKDWWCRWYQWSYNILYVDGSKRVPSDLQKFPVLRSFRPSNLEGQQFWIIHTVVILS